MIASVALFYCADLASAQLAPRSRDSYPESRSKKGLQVEDIQDALTLGVKHAAINLNLSQLVDVHADQDSDDVSSWEFQGRKFYFKNKYVSQLDRQIKPLSDADVVVNLIILVYRTNDARTDRIMLHPGYDSSAPNRLGAFNNETELGRQWLAATMEFIAARWSRPDQLHGRVAGYIIGNEVNSHWWWSNMGQVSLRSFADDYLEVLRTTHTAIRRQSSWARVYISLDHNWNRFHGDCELKAFPGKHFVDYLASQTASDDDTEFDWHVAFHPYPEDLFDPRFWEDQSAIPSFDSPRITFKNLAVLVNYFRRTELLCNGRPRRIILSEQGFHSPATDEGEAIQAAAYCYAYKKVEALQGIDSFILHRHIDHPHEGGLQLGLRHRADDGSLEGPKKLIYDCFRYADTPSWREHFDFALPILGVKDWDEALAR